MRQQTNRALEMADEGVISWESLARMALGYMSEDEVADMLDANELSERFDDDSDGQPSSYEEYQDLGHGDDNVMDYTDYL